MATWRGEERHRSREARRRKFGRKSKAGFSKPCIQVSIRAVKRLSLPSETPTGFHGCISAAAAACRAKLPSASRNSCSIRPRIWFTVSTSATPPPLPLQEDGNKIERDRSTVGAKTLSWVYVLTFFFFFFFFLDYRLWGSNLFWGGEVILSITENIVYPRKDYFKTSKGRIESTVRK